MPKYLYVIRAPGGARKVGYSRDPEKRRRSLSTPGYVCALEYSAACPDDMVRVAERHAHALLWGKRTSGEYFDVDAITARRAVDAAAYIAHFGGHFRAPPRPDTPRKTVINIMLTRQEMEVLDSARAAARERSLSAFCRQLIREAMIKRGKLPA